MNSKIITCLLTCLIAALSGFADPTPAQDTYPPTENVSPSPDVDPTTGLAPLPSSQEMTTSYEGAFIRMLVTLGGLIFLVFATIWILRRLGRGKFSLSSSKTIQILEKRPLSPKTMLYVVEIDNKKVLISESQVEVRTLVPLKAPSE